MNRVTADTIRRITTMKFKCKKEIAEFGGTIGGDGCVCVFGRSWKISDM